MLLIHFLIVCLIFGICLTDTTPCNKLTKIEVAAQTLIERSPFTSFYSSWSIFNCSHLFYAHPQTGQTAYDLVCIASAETVISQFHLKQIQDTLWTATLCGSGLQVNFTAIYYNFNGSSNAFCVSSCSGPDGESYKYVVCLGKTQQDKQKVKKFYEEHGIADMKEMDVGCNRTCDAMIE